MDSYVKKPRAPQQPLHNLAHYVYLNGRRLNSSFFRCCPLPLTAAMTWPDLIQPIKVQRHVSQPSKALQLAGRKPSGQGPCHPPAARNSSLFKQQELANIQPPRAAGSCGHQEGQKQLMPPSLGVVHCNLLIFRWWIWILRCCHTYSDRGHCYWIKPSRFFWGTPHIETW